MNAAPRLVVPALLAAVGLAVAAPAHAATARCVAEPKIGLDYAAAAATADVQNDRATVVGVKAARALADRLNGPNPCTLPPRAATRSALARVDRLHRGGRKAQARAAFRVLLRSLRPGKRAGARVVAAFASPCSAGGAPTLSVKDSRIGDYVRAAATAQRNGDAAGERAAMNGARAAYRAWAGGVRSGSVGDFVAVATAGQALGLDDVAERAIDKARDQAAADYRKALQFDACTASVDDMRCALRAAVVAQLVGAAVAGEDGSPDAGADTRELSAAIEQRLLKKVPNGCEEWSFQMRMEGTTEGASWAVTWGRGLFRVNRATGVLDGSHLAGYGAGWPGLVGDSSGSCWEETDAGRIDHGPVAITGGGFHYRLGGSVSETGFVLSVSSEDAKARIDGPAEPMCQLLQGLAQVVLDGFLKGPYDFEIPLAPGETEYVVDEADAEGRLTIEVRRVR